MEKAKKEEKEEKRKSNTEKEDQQIPVAEKSNILTPDSEPREEHILAHILMDMLTNTAKMVQVTDEAEKAAQLAYYCAEGAMEQATKSSSLSRHAFLNAQDLGERLLKSYHYSGYQEIFEGCEDLPMGYGSFHKLIHKAESVLSNPKWKGSAFPCTSCTKDSPQTDHLYSEKVNRMLGAVVSLYGHKNLESIRNEEHMGGAYVTHRRRSPRHSPLSGVEAVSPLVSEDELTSIKSVNHSPSRLTSPKFLNKILRRERMQESSDSDTDHIEDTRKKEKGGSSSVL